ncbi:hypothetical protein SDC9_115963 [bioreactor metagenome]|uniref:Uncharacterized protein n=1 Tax=bioreactor metagenome TaxID=1076179 RepID=A0A645BUB0_9ZZZZ
MISSSLPVANRASGVVSITTTGNGLAATDAADSSEGEYARCKVASASQPEVSMLSSAA